MTRKQFLPILALISSFFLPTANLRAQSSQEISFPSGDDTARGVLYLPAGDGQHPALIVVHEWWGLNDWVKQQSQKFAADGYVTLAVDLYRGKVATDAEMAHELMRGLSQDRGVRDLTSAAAWLARRKDVDPHRIGAIGWCMGGGYAVQLAVADPNLRAVVINYGALPTDKTALASIHAAVLGNFGGLDRGITPDDVHAFEAAMQSLGKPVDAKIYPDAGHAFQNPANGNGYKPADTADAQARYNKFLAEQLHPSRR